MMMLSILTRSAISKCLPIISIRSVSSAQHHRPLMLMDLPRIAYPNVFHMLRNFVSRVLISGYFDSTFAIKPFSDGARQAVTVVSRLIANGQFNDLHGFVTREVINEVKENFEYLSPQQKQQIAVEENEIVFSHPYLIGMIMDDETRTRLVEITMIFHIIKDPESYREAMLQSTENSFTTWASTVKKMRDNMIICNYKFLRDMSKDAKDDSWIITGLNHWSPIEYLQQQE